MKNVKDRKKLLALAPKGYLLLTLGEIDAYMKCKQSQGRFSFY